MNLNQLWTQTKFRFVISGFVTLLIVSICAIAYAADSVGEPVRCSGHK